MSINRVNISGNLTREPDVRATQGGTSVVTFGMAVNDRRRNPQTGEWEDVPNFIDCVVFGNRADALAKLLTKGMKVAVEGKLRWSQWEDKSGGGKRSKIEVVVDEVEFLSGSKAQNQPQQPQQANYSQDGNNATNSATRGPQGGYYQQQPAADVYDEGFTSEDIPF